jgi:hypothetical protein
VLGPLIQLGQRLPGEQCQAPGKLPLRSGTSRTELSDYVTDTLQCITDVVCEVVGGQGPNNTNPH